MSEKIKIDYNELRTQRVDDILERETAMSRAMAVRTATTSLVKESFIYKSWFSLMIAGAIGAFVAWCIIEPYYSDEDTGSGNALIAFLYFAITGGLIGLMIGAVEGLLTRNLSRALKGGVIGLFIGFIGGIASGIIANIIFMIVAKIGITITQNPDPKESFGTFFMLVIARSLGWATAGMAVGLGPGIALKSNKLAFNGFLGGMLGGLIGGILFDPLNYLVSGGTFESGAEASRAAGMVAVGLMAGIMIGLVETFTKSSWLLMIEGPLAGKQFIVYKNPTVIGSSPNSEVYIFKDSEVESSHSSLTVGRDGCRLSDNNTRSGTWINGQRISSQILHGGDHVRIGNAQFTYLEREKRTEH
jgi:hypothetical protein